MDSTAESPALERLQGAYQAAPESRIFAPLADAYRCAGRIEEAVHVLEQGTSRHPHYVSALVLLALCQLDLGHTADAEASLGRVLTLDPENLVAIKRRAACALQAERAEEAAAGVDLALGIDPYDAEALQLRDAVRALRLAARPAAEPAAENEPEAGRAPRLPPQAPASQTSTPFTAPALPEPEWSPSLPEFDSPPSTSDAAPFTVRRDESEWQVQRDADRIIIRPRGDSAAPMAAPGAPAGSSAGRSDELSTLTLARIYESQGYFDKALAIYDELVRKHPGNAEIEARQRGLRERLQAQAAPSSATPAVPSATETPRWRLLDAESLGAAPAQTAEQLHQLADAVRAQGEPHVPASLRSQAERPAPAMVDALRREEPDFERFLRYVRSLKREG